MFLLLIRKEFSMANFGKANGIGASRAWESAFEDVGQLQSHVSLPISIFPAFGRHQTLTYITHHRQRLMSNARGSGLAAIVFVRPFRQNFGRAGPSVKPRGL